MITTTLLSLLVLGVVPLVVVSSPTSTAQSDSIHIPITRRSGKARGVHNLPKAADHLRAKYNYQTVGSKRKRAGNIADLPITNQVGSIFMQSSAQLIRCVLGWRLELCGIYKRWHAVRVTFVLLLLKLTLLLSRRPQQFDVILDSGSSDLWLANTQCLQCPSGIPEFDSTKSTTFTASSSHSPITIQYGGGSVQGVLGQDTVSMAGFIVPHQTFRKCSRN